jgi:hypothetical protein
MLQQPDGFYIAPFGIDGKLEGLEFWKASRLSAKWLTACGQFLDEQGFVFDASWPGNLSHIQTRFTSASGAAIVTFMTSGRVAASILLASGYAPAAEHEVIGMFIESLRHVELVRVASGALPSFERVRSISERPLMVVVPWPDPAIPERDHQIVRELALHLAAAFFSWQAKE